jgi:D-serine deaminase-like pyridoxal phosphate-dependent protein
MLSNITRPSLIINRQICQTNIQRMLDKARASNVIFRPHFKTHQSIEVASWFKDFGVDKITVSSLEMAQQYAKAGWNDITIAFPANIREIKKYNALVPKIRLNLLVDSEEVASALSKGIRNEIGIFVEVDCGYARSGVHYNNFEKIDRIINVLTNSETLVFRGFLSHFGNTYQANSTAEIEDIYHSSLLHLNVLKSKFKIEYPEIIVSVGDTPTCSILADLSGADEIRPGNFVYNDLMQYYLNSCTFDDIAVTVACPVCGIYPDRNEIVIYGGAIHFSKDSLDQDGQLFGLVVQYSKNGWTSPLEDCKLISISQEHGVISASDELMSIVKHGDLLGILPIHSCLTADLLKVNIVFI